MNDLPDSSPRRPSRRVPRAIAHSRRFADTPWAALAAAGAIMLLIALAAFAGAATM
jgi:hypothetical protein